MTPCSVVTVQIKTMSGLLLEVEGWGSADVVSSCSIMVGAGPAARGLSAWLSTSSRPWSLGSGWPACSACSSRSWARMRSMVSCSRAPIWSAPVGIAAWGWPAGTHCTGSRLSLGTDHTPGWWRTSSQRPSHCPANDKPPNGAAALNPGLTAGGKGSAPGQHASWCCVHSRGPPPG